jgi:hypothetical protein
MLMGLFQRLFGATRDAIAVRNFDAGNKAVEISTTMLRECIDLGSAWPGGPNRERLTKPFARGYIFGFSDACIQRLGVLDELDSLTLITLVYIGATAGAEDLLRWVDDRSYTPLILTDYLYADDEASSLLAPTGESPAESDIEPSKAPSMHPPSKWGTAPVRKKATVEAAPARSASVIRLPTRLNAKTVKRIERDEH